MCSTDYKWINVTLKAEFAPRDGAGAVVLNNTMWLIGGWNPIDKEKYPRICSNDVWSSKDGKVWTMEKQNTFLDKNFDPILDWQGRHCAGYVVYKDKMWIVGGDVNQGYYQNDVWNSVDGKKWTYINQGRDVPWGPRALYYTVVFKDKIWVMGGQTMPAFAPSEEIFYTDVWNTSDGINWKQIEQKEPHWTSRGTIGGSVIFNDEIWMIGGASYDTPQTPVRRYYGDIWSSSDGIHWKCRVKSAPWESRMYHDVAVFDGKIWVLEGYRDGENKRDVWYSNNGIDWTELPGTPWKPRHAASIFVYDNALWVVAGNNMESDVWKLVRN